MTLKANKIKKKFLEPVPLELLKGIELSVEPGQTIAIMGKSGEGKSTLLHILGTLDTASEGTLEIAGQPVTRHNVARIRNESIGFVFQSFYLLEDYTVLQNALMPAKIARKAVHEGSRAYFQAVDLLEQVGLKDRMHHFGKQLSGGEKQRVAIARALCNNPEIIFADEPSGNLDSHTAIGIHSLLLNFAKEKKKSLILVTHDQDLANLCDVCYSLKDGLLVLT